MDNNKSMWFKLRKEYSNYTQKEWAEKLGKSRNTVLKYENGMRKIPPKIQIEYLKLRNNKEDELIINYLEKEKNFNEYK